MVDPIGVLFCSVKAVVLNFFDQGPSCWLFLTFQLHLLAVITKTNRQTHEINHSKSQYAIIEYATFTSENIDKLQHHLITFRFLVMQQ